MPVNSEGQGTVAGNGGSLAWNPSTDKSAFSYLILAAGRWSATVPSTQTSFNWTANLEAGKSYYFIVGARDAAGNQSKFSNLVTVTTPPDVIAPSAPAVSVLDVGPTHACSAGRRPTTGRSSSTRSTATAPRSFRERRASRRRSRSSSRSRRTPSLPRRATTVSNWSPVSAPVSFTTPTTPNDVTPPTVPTNFSAWSVGDGSGEINAFWTASTDDHTPQSLIRYNVYLNGELVDWAVGFTRSVMYGVNGTNFIELKAVDAAGNESAAATATVELQL